MLGRVSSGWFTGRDAHGESGAPGAADLHGLRVLLVEDDAASGEHRVAGSMRAWWNAMCVADEERAGGS